MPTGGDAKRSQRSAARAELDLWALTVNLNVVQRHFTTVEGMIEASVDPSDGLSEMKAGVHREKNAANAVLQVCAYLSEALWIIADGDPPPRDSRNLLQRFKPVLKARGLHVGGQDWETLIHAFDVRHCLLHTNGRLSLMDEAQQSRVERALARHPEGLRLRHDRVRVHRPFVKAVMTSARWMVSETSEVA